METNEKEIPEIFLVLRFGKNVFTKNGETSQFDVAEADVDAIIREFEERKRDLVIDYEHQSLNGQKAPAAGWIDRLEKTAEGLQAHVRYWTEDAQKYLKSGEYRYFSPTLYFSEGKPVALHSVALTNHPALHCVEALVASDINSPDLSRSDLSDTKKERNMTMTKTELALQKLLGGTALALNDSTDEMVAAKLEELAAELPALREKAAKCEELLKAAVEAAKAKKEEIFSKGAERGAFSDAVKGALMKLSLEDLETLEKNTPDGNMVPTQKLPKVEDDPEKTGVELTDEEKAIAKKMGMTDAEFAAAKKACAEKEKGC